MRRVIFALSVALVAIATGIIYVAGFQLGELQIPIEIEPSLEKFEKDKN